MSRCFSGFSAWLTRAWMTMSMAVAGVVAAAADLRPSWDCLPDATAAAVRLPQAADFLRAIRDQTKFGGTMLSAGRLEKIQEAVLKLSQDAGKREEVGDQLAKYGLSWDDLKAVMAGDMGLGLVMPPAESGSPAVRLLLGWLEPGADAAGRLLAAVKQIQEETQDQPHPTKRVDLEMAGREVVWLTAPLMRPDLAGIDLEAAGDGEKLERLQKEIAARIKEGKLVQYDESHLFLCRIDGRLLVGMTLPDAGAGSQVQLVAKDGNLGVTVGGPSTTADSGPDPKAWSARAEAAKPVFERYLAAHTEAGDSPLSATLQTPGMQDTLPGGLPLIEAVVRPQAILAAVGVKDTAMLRPFGLDDLGPLAWRQTLDDGRLRSGLFVSLPGPRRSLMQILDQPCDESDIPPFATSETIDLTQISLDLGAAYTTTKEVALAVAGGNEQTQNMFNAAEAQTLGLIGLDLPKLLSSLGTRHWIVSYPSRIAAALAEPREAGQADAAAGQNPNRLAVVWQVEDEAPFTKILQRLAPLAGGELKDEQGFRGLRVPGDAGFYVGHRHLLVAIGADTVEKTMSAIRNPPAAAASLRESAAMQRVRELMPLPPCRAFGVSDSSRTGGLLGTLRESVAALTPDDVPAESRELLAAAQPLLPTAAEIEGMFGVGAWTLEANEHGVALRSIWEMPAP